MRPVTRIWALSAACIAALCALRGLWPLAIAIFLMSPAPAWAFAGRSAAAGTATASWLRAVGAFAAVVTLLYLAAIAMGGLPPVHEWRHALTGAT